MNQCEFLQASTGSVVGLASMLVLQHFPATAQTRELTVLSLNHLVPQSDEELKKQAAGFSRRAKVKVTIDSIAGLQLPAKVTAEGQTGAGHHDVALPRSSPYLDKKQLDTYSIPRVIDTRAGNDTINHDDTQVDALTERLKRQVVLHQRQRLMHERAMHAPIFEPVTLHGVGPRVEEAAVGMNALLYFAAPYEEMRLKRP
jgi:hypothetical protein